MFLLARDRFAPWPFLRMGARLAFNGGIVFLSIVATLVFVTVSGNTSSLIPLHAVGVFLALCFPGRDGRALVSRGEHAGTSIMINAVG
jgi:cell division protein FtsX